jgi:glycosyltransferase involved in cell wall biosynthesis
MCHRLLDAGGIPESVINGQTGLIFPVGDLTAFKEGLIWCWEHQNQLKALGANGRQHIQEKFTWDAYAHTGLEVYDAAIEHHAYRNHS